MSLLYRESGEIDSGRDMTHDFEGVPVTPNDTLATYSAQIDAAARAITAQGVLATGAGAIALVLDAAGNTAVITVPAGGVNKVIPVSFIQVKATGTTATGVSVLFRKGG